jgi:Mg2+/Co2+ transporter CorB
MEPNIMAYAAFIFILMLLSAFTSACETALTGASKAKMHALEKEGNKRAALVNHLRENSDLLIGAILLLNNIMNVLSSAIATTLFLALFGDTGVIYATIVMTVLIFVFGEVLPKTIALGRADYIALSVVPIINLVVIVLSPVLKAVSKIIRFVLTSLKVKTDTDGEETETELRGAIELHEDAEIDTQEKRAMLHSILDLADVEVSEIMSHRSVVETIDISEPINTIVEQILDNAYTRLPVYSGSLDNIVGVLHAKSVLRELATLGGDFSKLDISTLMTEPWFIPNSTILFDQLQAFRKRKEHFAIVVDEYGTFIGIVTLEDILEEIVGEIEDEHDITIPGVRPQTGGVYVVDGTVTIRDLNRASGWNLPDDNYSTVAGLVLHESKIIPEVGQVFSFYGFRFRILKRERNQITLVRVAPESEAV